MADNAEQLGGDPGQLMVGDWSIGQALLAPVTDTDPSRISYAENGEGYDLDATLMRWSLDLYTDPVDRIDPRIAPLRAADLTGLPPAVVVTRDFDVLRDEGEAYADAPAVTRTAP